MTSVSMFPPALMYHNGNDGIQDASISFFQKPEIGLQVKIWTTRRETLQADIATAVRNMNFLAFRATKW